MKKWILCSILAAGLLSASSCSVAIEEPNAPAETRAAIAPESAYYWYEGQKIQLTVDPDKKFVLVDASARPTLLGDKDAADQTFVEATLSPRIVPLATTRTTVPDRQWMWAALPASQLATRAAADAEIVYEAPYFRTEEGYEVGLSHLLYVKLNDKSDESVLLRLAADNGVEVIGYNEFMPLWYTLCCTSESAGNALEIANLFYETGLFAAAEPSFVAEIKTNATTPNDPFFLKSVEPGEFRKIFRLYVWNRYRLFSS